MAHNSTRRNRATEVLRAKLTDFTAWHLTVDCGGRNCPRGRIYDVALLARDHAEETVSGAIRRMRCNGCGCSPTLAVIRPKSPIARKNTEIPLIGPGSI